MCICCIKAESWSFMWASTFHLKYPPISAAAWALAVLQCKGLMSWESPILMLEVQCHLRSITVLFIALNGNDTKPLYLSILHSGRGHNVTFCMGIAECLSEICIPNCWAKMVLRSEMRCLTWLSAANGWKQNLE